MLKLRNDNVLAPVDFTDPSAGLPSSSGDLCKFNYNLLEPSVAKFLIGQVSRIRQYATKSIIQIGKDLNGAKHYLSHGDFLRWVEVEVGIPARTAQAYMRVAAWASSKRAAVSLLAPTALYALSSPGVPPEFAEDVVRRVEAGERIQLTRLREQVKVFRKPKPEICD